MARRCWAALDGMIHPILSILSIFMRTQFANVTPLGAFPATTFVRVNERKQKLASEMGFIQKTFVR
jgi:hypothetical protein